MILAAQSPIDTVALLNGYDANADADGYVFDTGRAEDAIWWIQENCTHIKGPLGGQPFLLQPWQQALIATLFGWICATTQTLRYTEVLIYIPRKNGKTPLVAAIGLYILSQLRDPGFEGISAAASKNQATLLFTWMSGMIRASAVLARDFKIYAHERKIVPLDDLNAAHQVIPSDADLQHGGNLSLVLMDELHVQRTRELYDVLKTGQAARENPLFISLTTADTLRDSICNDRLAKGLAVVNGTLPDSRFLPVLYFADPADDWDDLATWKKANPNYGVSIRESWIRDTIQACRDNPSLLPNIKRLNLNLRLGAASNWLALERWRECPESIQQLGHCYAGLDLASTDDLTALVLFWPDTNSLLARFYVPSRTAEIRPDYDAWIEAGYITVTEGDVTDYAVVHADIGAAHEKHHIVSLGYDARQANELVTGLYNENGINCAAVAQNMATLSEPAKAIEKAVLSRSIRHGYNPVLTWMAGNVVVKLDDNDNILPTKKHSTGKIDGIAALINAKAVAMAAPGLPTIEQSIIIL